MTETWLNKHGFKYHGLLMNKPRGGNYHWVDNHIVRATRYEGGSPIWSRSRKPSKSSKAEVRQRLARRP